MFAFAGLRLRTTCIWNGPCAIYYLVHMMLTTLLDELPCLLKAFVKLESFTDPWNIWQQRVYVLCILLQESGDTSKLYDTLTLAVIALSVVSIFWEVLLYLVTDTAAYSSVVT